MRTTFNGVDVVDIGVQVLGVGSVVHNGYFDGGVLLLGVQIDYIIDEWRTARIDVANKVAQTTFAIELLRANAFYTHFGILFQTHIGQRNGNACIQVSQLTHAIGQRIVLISSGNEDAAIGPELLTCTANVGFAHNFHTS